jgi:3-hydroxyisobutyryl-CoA hydrolase
MERLSEPLYFKEINEIFKLHKKELDSELIIPFNQFKNVLIKELNSYFVLCRFQSENIMNTMDIDVCKEVYTIEQRYLIERKTFLIIIGNLENTAFSTGADLKMLNNFKSKNFITFYNFANYLMYRMNKFYQDRTLFIWNGFVMGGGFGISSSSNFRIATESTILTMPESKFGYFANCFFNFFISKVLKDPNEAIHMAIFNRLYKSYEVYLKKFATHFILNKYMEELISSFQELKYLDYEKINLILTSLQKKSELEYFSDIQKTVLKLKEFDSFIKKTYSFNFQRSYHSDNFLEFYKNLRLNLSHIQNGRKLLKELNSRSLISLHVNYKNVLSSYENFTFEDYYDLDIFYTNYLAGTGDVEEGIRAFFVDKDMAPKWKSRY